jgi:hypothetical protein
MGVDRDEMEMWVPAIISLLVVDCHDIAGDSLREALGEGAHQGLTLGIRRFDGQGDDEALADPSLACQSAALGFRRCLGVGLGYALTKHDARCLGTGDVAQMRCRLSMLRRAGLLGPLLRKSSDRVTKSKKVPSWILR